MAKVQNLTLKTLWKILNFYKLYLKQVLKRLLILAKRYQKLGFIPQIFSITLNKIQF